MTLRRTPRPRTPRNALGFIREALGSLLNRGLPNVPAAELHAELVRMEKLAVEALYPAGEPQTENTHDPHPHRQ